MHSEIGQIPAYRPTHRHFDLDQQLSTLRQANTTHIQRQILPGPFSGQCSLIGNRPILVRQSGRYSYALELNRLGTLHDNRRLCGANLGATAPAWHSWARISPTVRPYITSGIAVSNTDSVRANSASPATQSKPTLGKARIRSSASRAARTNRTPGTAKTAITLARPTRPPLARLLRYWL